MQTFIRFLIKHYFILLFLILEMVSIVLLINVNKHHRAIMFEVANETRGSAISFVTDISGYFALQKENEKLVHQNAELLRQLNETSLFTDSSFLKSDSIAIQQFQYTTAEVVSNSINYQNNYIVINKGYSSGIEKDMGVISPNGVVGIVVATSEHFSKVMSILHSAALISSKIKGSGYMGPVIWQGDNISHSKLKDIPGHAKFSIGDTVVTSGYSFIFPENINVGVISGFDYNKSQNYFEIDIDLTTDFSSLKNVFIINNLMKYEQDSLFLEK